MQLGDYMNELYDIILVRYGEMTLKKKNYKQFLKKVNDTIKYRLKKFNGLKYSNTDYRFYIYLNGEDYMNVINELNYIPGLYSYSLCVSVDPNYDAIAKKAIELIKSEMNGSKTFKVETNRGDKSFKATSIEISQEVAKRVLPNVEGLTVDIHHPQITLNIDLRTEGTYIFVKSVKGLGGYPAGIGGTGLLMMSGGLDSPVAGFLTIKKGVKVTAIHYESQPYTSLNSLQKVVDLLQVLSNYTDDNTIDLFVVPFTKIQDEIHNKANQIYLVTLMRRAMYKIASLVCKEKNIDAIINGESIGQVASQTLESIKVVNDVTNIPILRPVCTYDKEEIIEIARKIKTYDISIKPYEDCCTVFVPEHPIIKPNLNKVIEEENKCDMDNLIKDAKDNIRVIHLNNRDKYSVFDDDLGI